MRPSDAALEGERDGGGGHHQHNVGGEDRERSERLAALSKASCNVYTSDYATRSFSAGNITPTNPGGFGSNWCGAAGVVKLSADLTAMTNLK